MTDPTMALMEYLRNVGLEPDERFLQEGLQRLTQTVMELEASQLVCANRYERTPERRTYRNGHRERMWETRVGEIPLRIPKVRDGTYFPSLLEPRRRSEKALLAGIQQAYVEGVSTRRGDDLLQALGLAGGAGAGAFHQDPAGARAPRRQVNRGGRSADHLRPAGSAGGGRSTGGSSAGHAAPLAEGGRAPGAGRRRHLGVYGLSWGAVDPDLLDEPAGTTQ